MFLRFVVIFAALFGVTKSTAQESITPTLSVYFPDYRYREGITPQFYGTTHLILFSAKPNEDGSVDFSRITPGLLAIGAKARSENKIKVTFCVGGWGRGKLFATAVSTEERRTNFVDSLTGFCQKHQLDGVDIDWEYPKGDQEHADFTAFLQSLSTRLRSENRILTVALADTRPLSAEAYACIDQVNVMCYQPWNPTPYEKWLEDAVKRMLDSGLPPQKLNIGLPFFAKELGGERRAISWKKLAGEGSEEIPESEHEFTPVGKSICDLRLALLKKYNLGGIMIWDYGHDSEIPEHSLLRYLSENL